MGEMGMSLADRSGYVVWGLHRLLPIMGEAHLRSRNLDQARQVAELMRSQSERLEHGAGLAWAESCEAILAWLEGDPHEGARRLRQAAESLDAIPLIWDSARVRRQLAGRLMDIGDRDGAHEQLERVHATFLRLGASTELEKTRGMFREIGVEPPPLPDPSTSSDDQ